MKPTYRIFALLVLPFVLAASLWSSIHARQGASSEPQPLVLTGEQREIQLGRYLQLLEDPGGELTIDDVTSPEYQAEFVPSKEDVPNFGFNSSDYWVRFSLRNESDQAQRRLLELDFVPTQLVDLYIPLPDGSGFTVKQTGALRPLTSRDYRVPEYVFDLLIPPESEQTYYLRFESGASMTLPLSLWMLDAFMTVAQMRIAVESAYYGALLIMALYTAILFLSVRERLYFDLMLVLVSMILFEATYSGYLETYWAPNLYFLKPYYFPAMFILLFVTMDLYTDSFLALKRHDLRLHRLNIITIAGWVAFTILIPFVDYLQLTRLVVPYALLSTGFLILSSLKIWRQGVISSRMFLVGWLGLLVAFIITVVTRSGFLPSTVLTDQAYQVGAIWLALGWSIALSSHINRLKSKVETNERRLSQILESLPVGVVMYEKDRKPSYANQRVFDILTNPAREIAPDLSVGRTLEEAMVYFSFRTEASDEAYPLADMPVHRALQGEAAVVDDIEADLVDWRVPLEIWASPIVDDVGNVESAIVAFQDITLRKQAQAELQEYQSQLENMVEQRTGELHALNEWISFVNEVQHTLPDVSHLAHVHEQIVAQLKRATAAATVALGQWREPAEEIEFTCLLQDDSQQVVRRLAVSANGLASLRRLVEQDELQILAGDSQLAELAPLAPCMTDPEISSIILAPFRSEYGTKGLLVLWLLRPTDSFTQNETRLFERVRADLASLSEYEYLYDAVRQLGASEERNRLARDLHDSVTQGLFSASVLADILPTIWRRDPEQAAESLEVLRQLTRGALAELRMLLIELRPAAIIKTPLYDLISQLVEATASRTDLTFRLLIEQTPTVPEEVHVAFYRVAQEALNNVVKHAQASRIEVRFGPLDLQPASALDFNFGVRLVIKDDGVGFEPEHHQLGHMGLSIMYERAKDIDAELLIDSQIGSGTTVSLTWPGPWEPSEHMQG